MGRIISNFTKVQTFSSFMTTKCLWGQSHNTAPLLAPSKKAFLFSSVWPRREHTWTYNWEECLLICFENYQGVPYSHWQSRNRMVETFIIVNTNPTCLEDKSMFVHSKKTFLLPSVWQGQNILGHSFERKDYWFVLKAIRVFPIPTQENENAEHFANG